MNSRIFPLLAMLLCTGPAVAEMKWLDDQSLSTYCKALLKAPETAEATTCLGYIQGFLEGADATRGAVAATAAGSSNEPLSRDNWHDRALLTRAGSHTDGLRKTSGPGFCIPPGATTNDIVQRVAHDLGETAPTEPAAAKRAVHRSLMKHYPCSSK